MDDDIVWVLLGGLALWYFMTQQPAAVTTAATTTAAPSTSSTGPVTITMTDTNTGSTSSFMSDEQAFVQMSGAPPNQQVSYTPVVNGVALSTVTLGMTDARGMFSWQDTMSPSLVGSVQYQWMLNGLPVGTSSFTVTAPTVS